MVCVYIIAILVYINRDKDNQWIEWGCGVPQFSDKPTVGLCDDEDVVRYFHGYIIHILYL